MKKLIFIAACAVVLGGCGLSKTAPYTPPASTPTAPPQQKGTPVLHACTPADIPAITAALDKVNGGITLAETSVDEASASKADTTKMKAAVESANKALSDALAVCQADDVQIDIANCTDKTITDSYAVLKTSCDKVK